MVELKDKTIKVTKEASEIGEAIRGIAGAIVEAKKDGWQLGQDIPAIIVNSLPGLISAIEGFDKLPEEAKQETAAFVKGILDPLVDIPFLFLKKDV